MEITVIKQDIEGNETWRYSGELLEQDKDHLVLEAPFNLPDTPFYGILLAEGDNFIETYYTQRWYNIFEIHGKRDGILKGWYCNVSYPAEFEDKKVCWKDLALDLLVFPDGKQLVLDQDEFEKLQLTEEVRSQARTALQELKDYFKEKF